MGKLSAGSVPFRCERLLIAAAVVASLGTTASGETFVFPEFATSAGLNLGGLAVVTGGELRLLSSAQSGEGSAWYATRMALQSFDTSFVFELSDASGISDGFQTGGDGFAFVAQNTSSNPVPNSPGAGIGYASLLTGFAVEFDTYFNSALDETTNHVAVYAAQNGDTIQSTKLAEVAIPGDYYVDGPRTARIAYDGETLDIFLDDLTAPIISISATFGDLGLAQAIGRVGFTAGSDDARGRHAIQSWSFASPDRLIFFADDDAPPGGDGLTWATAHRFVQDAILDLNSFFDVVEVGLHIGQGVYFPDEGSEQIDGDINSSFRLSGMASIRGGFAGFGAFDPNEQRPWLWPTVLSGDLDQNDALPGDNTTDNCNVILDYDLGQGPGATPIPDSVEIDGIIIEGAQGREGPSGICVETLFETPVVLTRIVVRDCVAADTSGGGGGQGGSSLNFVIDIAAPSVWQHVLVHSCSSVFEAMPSRLIRLGGPAEMTNCSIVLNDGIAIDGNTFDDGGGMQGSTTDVVIRNSIVYDNSGDPFLNGVSDGVVFHSCIQGPLPPGPGNTNAPPMFVDAASGNFTLGSGSPCIDSGDNTAFSYSPPLDLAGFPRYQDETDTLDIGISDGVFPIIDMGVFEASGVYDFAGDARWIDEAGGSISDFLNWDPAAPAVSSRSIFDLPGEYTVDFGESAEHFALRARSGSVTLELNWKDYILGSLIESPVIVGEHPGDGACLTVRNGTLISQTGEIGRSAGSTGAVRIDHVPNPNEENQTEWFIQDDLVIGLQGSGSLEILNGASVDALQVTIGSLPGSMGSLLVSDGSTLSSVFLVNVESGVADVRGSGVIRAGAPSLGGVVLFDESALTGDGVVDGNVFNFGDLFGNRSTTGDLEGLEITGDYFQFGILEGRREVSGALNVLVDPLTGMSDAPNIWGTANLSGGLVVDFSEDLPVGQDLPPLIPILTAPSATGRFDVARLPGLSPAQDGTARFLSLSYPFSATTAADRGMASVSLDVMPLAMGIDENRSVLQDVPGSPVAAVAADIAGGGSGAPDGLLDLVLVVPDEIDPLASPGRVVVLLNAGVSGNGDWNGFTGGTFEFLVGADPSALASADLNNDGCDDVVVTNRADDSISILLNDGAGGLTNSATISVEDAPSSVVISQLDAPPGEPQELDIAVANEGANSVSILTNDGGTGDQWLGVSPHSTHSVGDSPRWIAALKSDDDKWEDLVTANFASNDLTYLATSGAPLVFTPVSLPVGLGPTQVIAATLDGDSDPDLIAIGEEGGTISIIMNQTNESGTLALAPSVEFEVGPRPRSIAAIDLTDDGVLDLSVVVDDGSGATNIVRTFRNDGQTRDTVVFAPDIDLATGASPNFILGADVDLQLGDDVVTLNSNTLVLNASVDRDLALTNDRGIASPAQPDISTLFEVCRGDANGDRIVDFGDLTTILGNWLVDYTPGSGAGDANRDSIVDFGDVTTVLGAWLQACD